MKINLIELGLLEKFSKLKLTDLNWHTNHVCKHTIETKMRFLTTEVMIITVLLGNFCRRGVSSIPYPVIDSRVFSASHQPCFPMKTKAYRASGVNTISFSA